MKKLILAAALLLSTIGVASATTTNASGLGDPFGTPIYVRGTFTDPAFESLENQMSFDTNALAYTVTIENVAAGQYEFKIASEDWATVDLGNIDGVGPISLPATVNAAKTTFGNFLVDIPELGDYIFTLDVSSLFSHAIGSFDGPFPLTIESAVVPVPAAGILLLSALGGLGFLRRRA